MRRLLIVALLLAGTVVVAVLTSEPETAPVRATSPAGQSVYSHERLQRDAEMTQRMSASNSDGPMQRGEVRDGQLDRSRNPGFVQALEQHQADITRMLARQGR